MAEVMALREMLADFLALASLGCNSPENTRTVPASLTIICSIASDRRARMGDIPSWHIVGDWFDNCSCVVPCPCTFAQAPDNGFCE
jgi:hypothetical protein